MMSEMKMNLDHKQNSYIFHHMYIYIKVVVVVVPQPLGPRNQWAHSPFPAAVDASA